MVFDDREEHDCEHDGGEENGDEFGDDFSDAQIAFQRLEPALSKTTVGGLDLERLRDCDMRGVHERFRGRIYWVWRSCVPAVTR